jgi:hypothetical protein
MVFATAHLRTELRTALTKTGWVAQVSADHLFATLPTAVGTYEQCLCDHPPEEAADDQALLVARYQGPDNRRPMIMTCDTVRRPSWTVGRKDTDVDTYGHRGAQRTTEQTHRRVIIVGVDDSAEATAAVQWAVEAAELRGYDVLLVHAYEVPILPARGRAATIARGRQERQGLLDKVAGTLTLPPTMHVDQLIEIDSPESLLPRVSEKAELTVLGQDHLARGTHVTRAYGKHGRQHVPTSRGSGASRLDGRSRRPSPDSSRHRRAASFVQHP